jgi:hypothetical protein
MTTLDLTGWSIGGEIAQPVAVSAPTRRSTRFCAPPVRAARTRESLLTTTGLVPTLTLLPAVLAIGGTRIHSGRARPPCTDDRA